MLPLSTIRYNWVQFGCIGYHWLPLVTIGDHWVPFGTIKYYLVQLGTEMEYCASGASMLAEEFWQIVEGFVEVPVNM